ncbi:hypothetical protein [Streptomyces sp. NPDC058548]|uniref:hypothetical protein n=1 Tax=Streptomyces sp. NPDC058548 TaxID=3346545 RepID=UPI003652763D
MSKTQPVEAEFTGAPMYELPLDYSQTARAFTVAVDGPQRHEGQLCEWFVVEAYSTEKAWAKTLAWYLLENETVDAYVVGGRSFPGVPPEGFGFFFTDLRPEHARRERLDDLADQVAELVAGFDKEVEGMVGENDHALDGRQAEYEQALDDAAFSAWPLVLELADSDGRD